jgi:hypothetical protein
VADPVIVTPSIWSLVSDRQRGTPLTLGVSRAVAQAFPLVVDDPLSERMKAALQALADRDPVTSEDRQAGSAR